MVVGVNAYHGLQNLYTVVQNDEQSRPCNRGSLIQNLAGHSSRGSHIQFGWTLGRSLSGSFVFIMDWESETLYSIRHVTLPVQISVEG